MRGVFGFTSVSSTLKRNLEDGKISIVFLCILVYIKYLTINSYKKQNLNFFANHLVFLGNLET